MAHAEELVLRKLLVDLNLYTETPFSYFTKLHNHVTKLHKTGKKVGDKQAFYKLGSVSKMMFLRELSKINKNYILERKRTIKLLCRDFGQDIINKENHNVTIEKK